MLGGKPSEGVSSRTRHGDCVWFVCVCVCVSVELESYVATWPRRVWGWGEVGRGGADAFPSRERAGN